MVLGVIALPIDLALGIAGGTAGLLAERYVTAPFVALGLLAVVTDLCLRHGTDGWLARRAQELGRVVLRAYVLQNLLGGALFYGWGFGVAESTAAWRVPVTMVALVVIGMLMSMLAHLWLRRFALGPVEWLWKRASGLGQVRSHPLPHNRHPRS